MENEGLKDEFFYLVGYLLTSARGLYDEPGDYGIFRLMDATERMLAILQSHGLTDKYLDRLQAALADEKSDSMDSDRQKAVLEQAVLDYTAELQRRLGA